MLMMMTVSLGKKFRGGIPQCFDRRPWLATALLDYSWDRASDITTLPIVPHLILTHSQFQWALHLWLLLATRPRLIEQDRYLEVHHLAGGRNGLQALCWSPQPPRRTENSGYGTLFSLARERDAVL